MFFFAPFLRYAHVVASQKSKDVGTEALNIACVILTGQRFALREGGRTVGAGVVSKVLT